MSGSTIVQLVFLALLALPAASLSAQAPDGTQKNSPHDARDQSPGKRISGAIVDESGAVIAGAKVEIRDAGGTILEATQSDTAGIFLLTGLADGDFKLVLSDQGFKTKEISIRLEGHQPTAALSVVMSVAEVNTTIDVQGRSDDLVGIADSGSQGTVGYAQIQDRPILRAGEILETIPGVIITQHAGGGKANQYFLRGFNLDHGTDIALSVDGMPLNLPSHAHGEGYADMNIVIPEFVQRVNFEKGPYAADIGNYGSAGAAQVESFRTLPRNFLKAEGGMFGYGRIVFGVSHALRTGSLLYGGEALHENGPWRHPDNFYKANGLFTFTQGADERGWSITARAYHGQWDSSDQIPANAVAQVGLFGTLNPTDGGRSDRSSLQSEWHSQKPGSTSALTAYGFSYGLDLFSDFTYFLTDPQRGDQFEQSDRRWAAGVDARHTIFGRWLGHEMSNTIGLQMRNDWIHTGLYQTENRRRVDKLDADTGTTLPYATEVDHFTDTQAALYAENRTRWAQKFRTVAALRGDLDFFDVTSLTQSANSGTALKILPSPKLSLIFGPWENSEFYLQGGSSFHSNDGRGATQTIEPVSASNPYPGTRAQRIPALIPTKGGELGARTAAIPHLESTLSLWYLHSASELQQDGDTGGTVASQHPSDRYGIESANYYAPLRHLAIDFDWADSKALYSAVDSGDAAPGSDGGRRVPEAVGAVVASGITVPNLRGFAASMRLRYFGPRDLTSDGFYRSKATALLNGQLRYQAGERWSLSADFLNLLNRRDHDIDYAYTSKIAPDASPAFTDVFHPVEPFQVRCTFAWSF